MYSPTDTTSHTCGGTTCGICGEPEEARRLRQLHVRPVLEAHAGKNDAVLAKLVVDELRPFLLAVLSIRQQAKEWSASNLPVLADAGTSILAQFKGTDWAVPKLAGPLPQSTAQESGHMDDDILHAPPQIVRQPPTELPRRFHIVREVDVTDISGVGIIGEGMQASDGAVAYRWLGGPPQDQPRWEVCDNRTAKPFVQISGHGGNTRIVWLDPPDDGDV